MRGAAVRGMMAVAIACACTLVSGGSAHAAQYRVSACGTGANYVNHLFSASTSDDRMSAYTACPNDSSGHVVGMTALAGIDRGKVPVFANAIQSFIAPPGTTINHVHLKADGRAWNGDWASLLQASNDRFTGGFWNLSGCSGNPGSVNGCVSALDSVEQNYDIPGATGVRALVMCGNFNGCTTFSTGFWPFTRSYYFIRDFDVTLEDTSSPSIAITAGELASGKWIHGTQPLTFSASDNSGIRRTRFTVDELGQVADDVRPCDYTFAIPCQNVTAEYSVDTSRLSDGVHRTTVGAVDATDSNAFETANTIFVDNHAPTEPIDPSVAGGEDWRSIDGFTIRWTNPWSAAPIDRAGYELCRSDGSGCVTGERTGNGISQLTNVRVGQPGDYTIRIWLRDAAGNESSARSKPLHLKFDDVAPAQAAPQHRNGWVDKAHSAQLDQQIDPPKAGTPPLSGIAGYAVTSDGSTPPVTLNERASAAPDYAAHRLLENLPEGVTTVRARAISGSGVASPEVGVTDIYVDLTPPQLSLRGQPEPNEWSRVPGLLSITATESELSGMASGPVDRGIESGAFIETSVDGQEPQRQPGPQRDLRPDGRLEFADAARLDLPVAADGAHTVTYRAVDVAGNETPERSISFKIDQTPPELAVFEAQQAADPQLITVAASDRTSGLADGGKIQMRRIAPSQGSWITLRTTRQDDRYFARVENATLPEGDYQFRATIPDQAGNEATAVNDRDGHEEVIHITPTQVGPYPTSHDAPGTPPTSAGDPQDSKATVGTVLTAGALQRKVASCKRVKRHGRTSRCPKPCKKPRADLHAKCARVTESLVHELHVPFGKRASARGHLATAGGTPIGGAEVTVLARLAMAGRSYSAVATVKTNAAGDFTYAAPPGASRTLDFHFNGDDTYKHADDQVSLRVPAAATIKVSRHSVRNGRTVRFTGKLRGRPYPARGKILDLQAYYRNRWRTFATPRASAKGKWAYRYRFEATRGTVIYKFRVRVRPTSDYAYELGYSKATKVRVTGR